jgi:hypothetical protein
MKLGSSLSVATLMASSLLPAACGGSAGDNSLFGSTGPGAPGAAGYGAGNLPPSYFGGSGGQPTFGGSPNGGAANANGGFGGTFVTGGAGGLPPPNGVPVGGAGGGVPDAGLTGGASGSGGSDASVAPPTDAPFNPVTCDFSGTWASYVSIDVTWSGTIVLLAGEGHLQQWNLTREVQAPLSTTVTAHTKPCGIFLPDLQTTIFNFFQKYGIRFPDALFDKGSIPDTTFSFLADITTNPITFKTDVFAIVIGSDLADATTAAWPAVSAMNLRDDDHDGKPGITVTPVTTNGYSLPPANLISGELADLVYISTRTVSELSGTISNCDRIEADVTIQTVNGKPGIDSTVVGCRKQGGAQCSAEEAAFVDGARPQFAPKGPGHMTIVRVPDSTTCKDVRNRFPLQ